MKTLREKIVKIRKKKLCFACLRKFDSGTSMKVQIVIDAGINNVYCCVTCGKLTGNFPDLFLDDVDMCYPEGCVCEAFRAYEVNSPEELLEKLNSQSLDKQ